jgi:pyruvate,water dikinase
MVAERKAEMTHFATFEPPMELGQPMPPPIAQGMSLAFGGHTSGEVVGEVHGQPGSPGSVTGTARVIASLLDADRLEPGDILVAVTTSPPWTPLFGIASGIVTDAGGAMSHCAIVAREYGIPAVVGCFDATARIADGDVITVDGDAGIVRLSG